ncbi:MAG: hypothetical protein ACM3N4_09060 [Nitrososphaerota archaeon]
MSSESMYENTLVPEATPAEVQTSAAAHDERHSGWRRVILAGLIMLVIAGGFTGYLLTSRPNTHKPVTVHVIDLNASKLYCSHAPVWSPDGRYLAVIALDVRCGEQNSSTTPDQFIAIFDTTTGKLAHLIRVKDMMDQLKVRGQISAISWSPDGKMLAVFGPTLPTSTIGVNQQALILYPTTDTGAAPRLISASTRSDPTRIPVWNVRQMAAGPVIGGKLPPALTYRWTGDGHIVTGQPLSAGVGGLTGRSASGSDLTFWQAGKFLPAAVQHGRYDISSSHEPTAVFFASSRVLWSRDGQYVVYGVGLGGPVAYLVPKDRAVTCQGTVLSQIVPCPSIAIPPLPLADEASVKVLKAVERGEILTSSDGGTTVMNWPEVPIVWSPNGKYLMTILPGDEERDRVNKTVVTIFDTITGNPVRQFQRESGTDGAVCGYAVRLAWSPTGTQIAMSQCSSDSIILWDTHNTLA